MKKLYVLCVLTLAVVVLDIVLFHTRSVNAVNAPPLRIDRIIWQPGLTSQDVPAALGHIVGFHCVQVDALRPECFVASTAN
jgi:hypothetical protein